MRDFAGKRVLGAAGAAIVAAGVIFGAFHYFDRPARLLLAPMMALDVCVSPWAKPTVDSQTINELEQSCVGPQGSAAALVEWTLAALQEPGTAARSNRYELGYTLNVPLLKLFKERDGDWLIDKELLGRMVRTLRDVDRPVILYLFSTHFGQNAPIEEALAADPANLSWTPQGPLPRDSYYSSDLFNWSLANTRTAITTRRLQAAEAVIREICKLEPRHIEKIRGVTLLGEVHHLFPNFQAGMGFASPYLVSDYSDYSKAAFRTYLKNSFDTIEQLNAAVGTRWTSFDQVEPPSKDIRTARLRDFSEHIDSFAHGFMPISGWAHVKNATDVAPPVVRIYRNGDLIARVPANRGRQDVLAALPELGTANTGWRFNMDFRTLPRGLHRIDLFLEDGPSGLVHISTRNIAILDSQDTPAPLPQKAPPASRPADASTKAFVDVPKNQSSYFYNPLVTYWHAFRASQVAGYIQSFNRALDPQCLTETPRYTHQIIPFTNPGWDETKFAVEASLQKLDGITLGVSLYGEPTYGTSFSQWLAATRHERYGVTEFHPLKALDAQEFEEVLEKHWAQGAQFISFFAEPRWKGQLVSVGQNLFSLDPDNREFGSAPLYESARQSLQLSAQPPRKRASEPLATAAPTRNTP